jgi:polysaccharide export outer membrane protein
MARRGIGRQRAEGEEDERLRERRSSSNDEAGGRKAERSARRAVPERLPAPEPRRPLRRAAAPIAAAAAAALAGCVAWSPGPVEPRLPAGGVERLGPGDLVRVEVRDQREVARQVVLGPDGLATLPLLGPVPLGGRTLAEATTEISTALQRYLREPLVTLSILEARSLRFEVLGEVYEPGSYQWFRDDTVVSAVERASGFVPATAAYWNVHLVRGALDRPQVWKIDLERILDAEVEDVAIEPGDIIYIPPRWITSWDRWVAQVFGPVTGVLGIGATATDVSQGGNLLFSNGGGFLGSEVDLPPGSTLVPLPPGGTITLPGGEPAQPSGGGTAPQGR